jgi:hypothetical protein
MIKCGIFFGQSFCSYTRKRYNAFGMYLMLHFWAIGKEVSLMLVRDCIRAKLSGDKSHFDWFSAGKKKVLFVLKTTYLKLFLASILFKNKSSKEF